MSAITCPAQSGDESSSSVLASNGLSVIPYPQQVALEGTDFSFGPGTVAIVIDNNASGADRFTAKELATSLSDVWNINANIETDSGEGHIRLTRQTKRTDIRQQGYRLKASGDRITVEARSESGLFYGTQTLLQLIRESATGPTIPGIEILDWPDITQRAIHYDTKHHQDKTSYVKRFIREMASYKINMLVWEWEDKFRYPSHPKIGAPGAFTMEEMQEFTRYARRYHIQLVPLVQGLGHVSFILKWPEFTHLREIDASNWEFCPLKEGSYELLFDLWEDAIRATPGSDYIHIGSDETYELGHGIECGCRQKAEEIGKSGLYHLFLGRAAEHLDSMGRKVMAWERPMGWTKGDSPIKGGARPAEDLVLTESYSYGTEEFKYVREAKKKGYPVFAYDPNPGIEPLFLPYYYRERGGKEVTGSIENSYNYISRAATSGVFDGMIRTSWDDAGLHNQFWMMQFLNAAEYSWSGSVPVLDEFRRSYYKNYYGNGAVDVDELYRLLNEASYYYWDTLERKVWHFGPVGKTHLPSLPRGDALEYDPYWKNEYAPMIERSSHQSRQMDRAIEIIDANLQSQVRHRYDFELFKTVASLVKHTAQLYLDLAALEDAIREAHNQRFLSHEKAYAALKESQEIVAGSISERKNVFNELVRKWEETRLPKGMSTDEKQYFHRQDRARHFANRRADMTYLIYDEQLLDMDEYLNSLRKYTSWYEKTFLSP